MSDPIRLRRHTDGCMALCTVTPYVFQWFSTGPDGTKWLTDEEVAGPGWSELLVAELPEPDRSVRNIRTAWTLCTGELTVGHLDGALESPYPHTVDSLRSDALKMLAAAAVWEQHRVRRETAT